MGRGIFHSFAGHRARAIAYYREAARVAEQPSAFRTAGLSPGNLAEEIEAFDPGAAADAARAAVDQARRAADRNAMAFATGSLADSLLALGGWDEAAAVLGGDAASTTELPHPLIAAGLLAALRGDVPGARGHEERLRALKSENPEVQANLLAITSAIAEADGDEAGARAAAAEALEFRGTVGINVSTMRWCWAAAARLAHD